MKRFTYKNGRGEWCVERSNECAIAACTANDERYYIGEPIDRLAEFETIWQTKEKQWRKICGIK